MMKWIMYILVLTTFQISAQDLEHLNLKKPSFYLDGGISAGIRSFSSTQPSAFRNSNFGYLGNARLNLHIHSLTLPFSYTIGDQLNLPNLPSFHYWGFSPKYKAFQLHVGHRSLRFSDHTLAGIQTYGLGLTIKTKKFQLQIAKGVLDRQRLERVIYNTVIKPRKEKKYIAGSIRFGSHQNHFEYSILSANEQENPIDTVATRYNLVNEIGVKKQLGKLFFVESNAAISYVDHTIDEFIALGDSSSSLALKSAELFGRKPNSSSKVGLLYGGSIGVKLKSFALSLDFNHIDRTFETFGRNFQITDVRTYTIKNRLQLFNNAIMINSRVGLQQNNLQDEKASNSSRVITNVNALARSKAGHTLSVNVSNFNLEKENLYVVGQDSFSFSFNALTISLSPQFQLGKARLIGNFNITKNTNEQQGESLMKVQKLLLTSISYEKPLANPDNLILLGANYSNLIANSFGEKLYGINLGLHLQWKNRIIFRIQYNPNINVEELQGRFLTHVINMNLNYTIKKHQSLFLSSYYQNIRGINSLRENQVRLGYRMQFSTRKNTENTTNN